MALIDDIMGGVPRQTVITFPNHEYNNITEGFHSGSLSLERTLNSNNNLTIGECNADKFECIVENVSDITHLRIQVKQIINEQEVILFTGYVDSAKQLNHRNYRKIVAYDDLYYHADTNVAPWYNNLFANTSTVSMQALRTSLLDFIGIDYADVTLINDDISIKKTIDTKSLRFDDILKLICEANGCYGHMSPSGELQFIYLSESSSVDLSNNYRGGQTEYEEYECAVIDALEIVDEDESSTVAGIGTNIYTIKDNWLLWGLGSQATTAADNLLSELNMLTYRPVTAQLIYSNPLVNVGDYVTFDTVQTYVFSTTLSGVQLFTQTIRATGDEYLDSASSNGVSSEVQGIRTRLNNLANQDSFSYFVQLYAEQDIATITPGQSITLYARVINMDGLDCTSEFPDECFKWIRQSEDMVADSTFNLQQLQGSELIVDYEENIASVTYICEVHITAAGDYTIATSTKTYVASDTYYNIDMYSGQFVGGTDLTDEYGVRATGYIEEQGSFENKGLYDIDLPGKHALVKTAGDYLITWGYETNVMEYWYGNLSYEGSDTVNYLDFNYANGNIFRLSENEGTYSIHLMTDPDTEDTLIYATNTKIKSWVTDGTYHVFLSDDNKIYRVDSTSTATMICALLSTVGAVKLAKTNEVICCIGNSGNVAVCLASDLTEWSLKYAGRTDDLVDVYALDTMFYIINTSGKVFKGINKFSVTDQFDANPISIQVIDIYMIVTYKNRIALKVESIALNLTEYSTEFGNESSTGVVIIRMLKLGNKYVYLTADEKLYYKTDLTSAEYTQLAQLPFEHRYDIAVSEDNTRLYMLGTVYSNNFTQNYISYTDDLVTWTSLLDTITTGNSAINQVIGNASYGLSYLVRLGDYLYAGYAYIPTSPTTVPIAKIDITNKTVSSVLSSYQRNGVLGGSNGVLGHGYYSNSSNKFSGFSTNGTSWNVSVSQTSFFENNKYRTFSEHPEGLLYLTASSYTNIFTLVRNDGTSTVFTVRYKQTDKPITAVQYTDGIYVVFATDGYVYASTNGTYWHQIIYIDELKVSGTNYGSNFVSYVGVLDNQLVVQALSYRQGTYTYANYIGGAE